MRPDRIISGGQTGADQGALVGAKQIGIATGGWMPKGFLTEAGAAPVLAELYGLKEHTSPAYPARTRLNAHTANATVWIGETTDSRGYRRTQKECDAAERPFLINPTAEELRAFVEAHRVRILNVAGPRASHDKFAHQRAAELIIAAFKEVA